MKQKKDIIKSLALHKKDVGSTAIQIGLLSNKIQKLSEHFKKFKKDKHSSRGLTKSVNQRKRLLDYLSKNDPKSYNDILKKLNLRK
jgi:small subunit ribosomal protein S15|tara:strand:- start:276 stop:533 length:258 start_codon:yes stop_codon:yes gene_type:complete